MAARVSRIDLGPGFANDTDEIIREAEMCR
jgi:hypothetical protein